MKYLLSLLLLFSSYFKCIAGKEYVDGYIVDKNYDTTFCKILIPKDFGTFNEMKLFSTVDILDSAGKKIKETPDKINGYGFIYQSKQYIYVSKTIDDFGKTMFVWPVNLGKKINEYYYYYYNSSNLDKGGMGSETPVYVLEDEAGEITSITRGGSITNNYKSQLREFFKNDKGILKLVVEYVQSFDDISRFVEAANK
jgi:hypothetical protein